MSAEVFNPVTSSSSDFQASIGYDPEENEWRDAIQMAGGDWEFVQFTENKNFKQFITALTQKLKNDNHSDKLTKEDYVTLESFNENDYNEYKKRMRSVKSEWEFQKQKAQELQQKRLEAIAKGDLSTYVKPYKKIFNGNFPTKDKSKLTYEEKVQYNVVGLDDREYDIFVDVIYDVAFAVYYDYTTTNEFFFEFQKYLKILDSMNDIGMNYKTPLLLFDRDLMGLDPSLPLSPQIRQKIVYETIRNPIYYFREVDLSTTQGGDVIKFEPTIASWTVIWLYCQNFNIYHEAPRQTGKTFILTKIMGYEFSIGSRNVNMLVGHFTQPNAMKNREAMIKSANNMPKFLRRHCIETVIKKGKSYKNVKDEMQHKQTPFLVNEDCNNKLKVVAIGRSLTTADQAGRGDSSHFVYIDELNFITYVQAMLTAVQYSHVTARNQAEAAGNRTAMLFSSTAGTLSTKHGREMYDMIYRRFCGWDIKLFGFHYDDLVLHMKKRSKNNFFTVKYAYNEMGFDEEWVEAALGVSSELDFQTEVLQRWLDVDEDSIFTQAQLSRCRSRAEAFIENTFLWEKNNLIIYHPEYAGATFEETIRAHNCIGIGGDIANGNSGTSDSSVLFAIDLLTGMPIFIFNSNNLFVIDMSRFIKRFMHYLKDIAPHTKVILNIENNGPGQTLLPMLYEDEYVESCLFRCNYPMNNYRRNQAISTTTRMLSPDEYVEYGTDMKKWRPILTEDVLFNLVEKYPQAFDFKQVFHELSTLYNAKSKNTIDNKKSIKAKPGCHDDNIMAVLHAYSMIFIPTFKTALEKTFNVFVDFRNIKAIPLTQVLNEYEVNDRFNNIEGRLEWRVVTSKDPDTGGILDRLFATKIINGQKKELTSEEIFEESLTNDDLKEALEKLRKPSIAESLEASRNAKLGVNTNKGYINTEAKVYHRIAMEERAKMFGDVKPEDKNKRRKIGALLI